MYILNLSLCLCFANNKPLKFWAQRNTTSHVTCGRWASSCTSCEYWA